MVPKIGLGYDIHSFAVGRKLFLGGVEIPFEKGLEGHSDADVLLHAVCDAVLGAMGEGDIGEHFPNNDPQYKDISSLILLERVFDVVKEKGYKIGNVDVMVLAEEPNIKKYKAGMKENISRALELKNDQVNIKATTQEKLGSIGRGEGIAVFANALLYKEDH